MAKLTWDGDEEPEDEPEEVGPDADTDAADDKIEEMDELIEESDIESDDPPEDPKDCEHPWNKVTREKMKRVVRGSTIDSKDIYWCDACSSILDVIE